MLYYLVAVTQMCDPTARRNLFLLCFPCSGPKAARCFVIDDIVEMLRGSLFFSMEVPIIKKFFIF